MTEAVDKKLFLELTGTARQDVEQPPICTYDSVSQCYRVLAWGGEYQVYPEKMSIEMSAGNDAQHDYFYVFLVNFLLSKKSAAPKGEWISVKDLVGGVTFFRGPHEIPAHLISEKYENDLLSLQQRCEKLGGKKLTMADCSYEFNVVGSVNIALLYWQGDEDFPPEAKILLDGSVAEALKLDVVYALLCDACVRIAGD